MRKIFLSLALATVFASCNSKNNLTVKLSDVGNDSIVVNVLTPDLNDLEKKETIGLKNGEGVFNFEGEKARMAIIHVNTPEGRKGLEAWLIPGVDCLLTGKTTDYKVSGCVFHTDYEAFKNTISEQEKKQKALFEEFKTKVEAGEKRDSLVKIIGPAFNTLEEEIEKKKIEYIKANPTNNVSAALLVQVNNAEELISLLSADVKNGAFSDFVAAVQKRIDTEKARKEAQKDLADGMMAPDFTLKDLDGNDLALTSLRGKYVVLDFWGSWCGWCIKGIPEMKKYYEKYSGKLEILGIDCNDSDKAWRDAVAKHQIPWKHVYNPRSSNLTTTYAIEGFPTKIIVDPQGKIVKTVVGEDPAFYTFLDELLK